MAKPQLVHTCVAVLAVKCGKTSVLVGKLFGHSGGLQGPAQPFAECDLVGWLVGKRLNIMPMCESTLWGEIQIKGTLGQK